MNALQLCLLVLGLMDEDEIFCLESIGYFAEDDDSISDEDQDPEES